ncbi:MAG: apolipoprotein N-acyltransferase [Rhizomicrobium sp.]
MFASAEALHPSAIASALARTGDFIRTLKGWRRAGAAFGAGALSALSFAPFGLFPLLLAATAVLVLLIDGAQDKKRPLLSAAWVGWWWGFGQFLIGLYWVGYAFLVDAAAHEWQIPFVEVLLPGGLALFFAGVGVAASLFWRPGPSRIFVLAVAYGIGEWLRGHILTGFPWNIPAYGWGALPGVLQSTALFGSYGLSLLTVLFGASLAQLTQTQGTRAWQLPAVCAALFVTLWLGGDLRLALTDPGDVPGVRLRLVQPDIPQKEKDRARFLTRNWRRLIDLSRAPATAVPTHIIWPEAALLPAYFLLTYVPEAPDDIAILTGAQHVLMTGAVRAMAAPDGSTRFSNSFYIFAHGGELVATYDKFHLVPFGEYMPLASFLERLGIDKLVELPGSFMPGDGPHTYDVPGAPPAGPLICYEIIFPGAVIGERRPGWFVNVTDDSWFGPSSGPYQHLLSARVRAIEEGIPVARDANTGISAVIDALGRIRASLGLGKTGFVDSGLPRAVPPTPYARLGDWSFALLLLACVWGARRR